MLTINEQIYGLSLIWSESKYNFAFWKSRQEIDWDKIYVDTLKKVMHPLSLTEYYLVLSGFLSHLDDGHTRIHFPICIRKKFPIQIKFIDNKHYIINAADDCPIPVFSEILALNGCEINDYIFKRVKKYCWDNKYSPSFNRAYELLPYIENNDFIELSTSNGVYDLYKTKKIKRWNNNDTLKSKEDIETIYTSEELTISLTKDDIAIITILTFNNYRTSINFYKVIDKIKRCRGFVIDIRNNSGGNSNIAAAISKIFFDEDFIMGKSKNPVYIGTYKAWGNELDLSKLDLSDPWSKKVYEICTYDCFEEKNILIKQDSHKKYLNQPIVILINNKTASTAENFLVSYVTKKRAILVGETSSGTSGNTLKIELPGGGYAQVCTQKITYPDSREFINIGIKPDIYASLSIEDFKNKYDSVLDKGIQVLRQII